jgi:hypothetical protein
MEILDKILKEQEKSNTQIEKLTEAVNRMGSKVDSPKPVQLDMEKVTNKIYGSLAEPINGLKTELETTQRNVSRSVSGIPRSIPVSGVMGFTSVKSMVAYLIFLSVPLLVSSYVYFNYQESRLGQRLNRANKHIESVDKVIKDWIKVNPNDSKSFKAAVNVEVIGETY